MNVVTELLRAIKRLRPKVYALGECPLENKDWIYIDGNTFYASTKAKRYGCAVYIRNEYVNMLAVDQIMDSYITVWTEGEELCFAYQKPDQRTGGGMHHPDNTWNRGSSNLLIGDMNAKHTSLSDGKYDAAGDRLKNRMEDRDLQVRNPFMLTHQTSSATHSSTTIDLVISEPDKAISVQAMHITTTDHRALCIAT